MSNLTPAIIDGLTRETGAIDNGPTLPTDHLRPRKAEERNGPIQIAQPAAGSWRCDGCPATGYGGGALLHHSTDTGHRSFTAL